MSAFGEVLAGEGTSEVLIDGHRAMVSLQWNTVDKDDRDLPARQVDEFLVGFVHLRDEDALDTLLDQKIEILVFSFGVLRGMTDDDSHI